MLAYYQGWNDGMVKILHGNISNASQGCDSEPGGRSQSTYCMTKKTCPCYTKSFFVPHRFTRNVLIAWHTTRVTFTSSSFLGAINHARLQLTGPSQQILTPHHRLAINSFLGAINSFNCAIKGQEGLEFLVFAHYGKPVLCGRKIP